MWGYLGSIALCIVSYTVYHSSQKLLSQGINPFIATAMAYTLSAIIAWMLYFLIPLNSGKTVLQWPIIGMAVAVVGLDVGFILAYRMGWNVSTAPVVANVAVALILIPLGLLLFKEKLSATQFLGILICLIGLLLVTYKK